MSGKIKDPRRVLQGARSNAQGKILEELISRACEQYKLKGLAVIEKTPEPMHIIKAVTGGRFIANFAKKAQPDFKGVLLGGKAVAFEAKHTSADRIRQDAVSQVQTEALERHHAMGAETFVIVAIQSMYYHRIPWEVWVNMKVKYGRKYITIADVLEYRVATAQGVVDFLNELG